MRQMSITTEMNVNGLPKQSLFVCAPFAGNVVVNYAENTFGVDAPATGYDYEDKWHRRT